MARLEEVVVHTSEKRLHGSIGIRIGLSVQCPSHGPDKLCYCGETDLIVRTLSILDDRVASRVICDLTLSRVGKIRFDKLCEVKG